jgi:tetratricopeptide (TPR) repeat protein
MKLLLLLSSSSDYPFAQGLFTAIIISILIFIFKLIGKGVTKASDTLIVGTGNINAILRTASAKINEGQIDDSIKLYKKVLESEPNNITALISLGNIAFSKEDFMNSELYYKKLYDNYQNEINSSEQSIKVNRTQLCLSLYKLGYIYHIQNMTSKANELKKVAFENCDLQKNHPTVIEKYNY